MKRITTKDYEKELKENKTLEAQIANLITKTLVPDITFLQNIIDKRKSESDEWVYTFKNEDDEK